MALQGQSYLRASRDLFVLVNLLYQMSWLLGKYSISTLHLVLQRTGSFATHCQALICTG